MVAQSNSLDLASVYDITLQGDETYLFLATSDRESDLVLEILDADGATLESVDNEFSGEPELFIWTAPADGSYSVRVANFYSSAFGHVFMFDALGEMESAEIGDEPLTLEFPASDQPQILIVLPDEEVDITLDGNPLPGVIDFSADDGGSGDQEILIAPASATPIPVMVDSFFGTSGSFEYKILPLDAQFEPAPAPISLLEDAELLASVEGGLSIQMSDVYTNPAGMLIEMSGNAGDRIALRLEGNADYDGIIYVYDQFGDLLLSVDDGFSGDTEVFALAIAEQPISGLQFELSNFGSDELGEYTISIYHDDGVTIDLIEPLENFDFDDGASSANGVALAEGEAASAIGEEPAFYTVTLSADNAYLFLAVPDADSDIEIELKTPVGNKSTDEGFSGEAELLTFEPTADGDYVVEVANFSFGEFEHTFAYHAVSGMESAEIADSGDSIFIDIEPSSQPQLLLGVPDESLDLILDAGAPDGVNELYSDSESEGGLEFLIIPPFEDTVVSVNAFGFSDSAGTFDYLIIALDDAFAPEPPAFTILLDDSDALASDAGLANQLSNSYEDDQPKTYRVSGSQGQRMAVRLEGDDNFDGLIVMNDEGGTELFSHDSSFIGEPEVLAVVFTSDSETTLLFNLSEFFGENAEYTITFYYDDGVTVQLVE